ANRHEGRPLGIEPETPLVAPAVDVDLAAAGHVALAGRHAAGVIAGGGDLVADVRRADLLSLQLLVVPTQRTGSVPVQWSSTVQNSPSSQEAVLGWNWSAGHNALVPVHFSSTSHWPAAIRQTVLLGAKASAGQSGPEPVQ